MSLHGNRGPCHECEVTDNYGNQNEEKHVAQEILKTLRTVETLRYQARKFHRVECHHLVKV